jgi:transglutaminase-like putative cysteine protease
MDGLTVRLRIQHMTSFLYADVVRASYNEARLSPAEISNQFTLEHRIEIEPAANVYRYRDYWGSRVHAFDLHEAHDRLVVTGTSVVETTQRSPQVHDRIGWEALDTPGFADRFLEYLMPTPATAPDHGIHDIAVELRRAVTPSSVLESLSDWLRATLDYQSGVTSVSTTATEVLKAGRGVCQDFAHLGLAVLRDARIPARYVSGYVYPAADDAVGSVRRGESHAWLEAWVGDWYPFDPTSGDPVAERHVVVARGRDYADVAPLKGVYNGGSSHELVVSVELTKIA